MQSLPSFFTPIFVARGVERKPFEKLCDIAENYFYLGGKRVCIGKADPQSGMLIDRPLPWQQALCKVALYSASLIALGFLIANPALAIPTYASIALKISAAALVSLPAGMLALKAWSRHYQPKLTLVTAAEKLQDFNPQQIKQAIETALNKRLNTLTTSLEASLPFDFEDLGCKFHVVSLKDAEVIISNRIKAVEVLHEESLDQINDIPCTYMLPFTKSGVQIAVGWEKKHHLQLAKTSVQKEEYLTNKHVDVVKQLAIFIAQTGLDRVSFNTIPLSEGKAVLLELVSMTSAAEGLFGSKDFRGLIHCVGSDEEVDLIISVAKQHGIRPPEGQTVEQILAKREEELKEFRQLLDYSKKRTSPRTPNDKLDEIKASADLMPVVKKMVDLINQKIEQSPKDESLIARGCVTITPRELNCDMNVLGQALAALFSVFVSERKYIYSYNQIIDQGGQSYFVVQV